MAEGVWVLAKLNPEQEKLLKEAEAKLGNGTVLAFSQHQVTPSRLTPDQLEYLQQLEKRLGMAIVAVKTG
jgi:hypothetical protein